MNGNQQPTYGGILTPGNSGAGANNGAPSSSFFISFAAAGDIVCVTTGLNGADGNTFTIPSGALAAGIVHPISFSRIKAGTSATGICYWT